jgi:uncharacterized membrane protein
MTFAASSQTGTGAATEGPSKRRRYFGLWPAFLATFIGLIAFMALLPDGVADPAQAVAGWLVVGILAAIVVIAIVKGLERLQDCETD